MAEAAEENAQEMEVVAWYQEFFKKPVKKVDHKAIADQGISKIGIGFLRNMTNLVMRQATDAQATTGNSSDQETEIKEKPA